MQITDTLIKRYTKKVMGFALTKTNDIHLAEELSQEIMLQLVIALTRNSHIENLDSYVYTLCCYTWSNYLRHNKKHWDNKPLENCEPMCSDNDVEQQILDQILIEKVKNEIGYLARIHRQITIMHYFDNLKSNEIAAKLNLKPSTVRWYLSESRRKLKEGMEMNHEQQNYFPQKLRCGHSGYAYDETMCGLGNDLLVSNIAIACYEQPLSITEIARKLQVAAAYLEYHIDRLVYMDYLTQKGDKYQTNFFIEEPRHRLLKAKFQYENIRPYAEKIYHVITSRMDDIINTIFPDSSLNRDMLLWSLIALIAFKLDEIAQQKVYKTYLIETPKRKDGSEHWVKAGIKQPSYYETQTEFSPAIVDFANKTDTNGIKMMNSPICVGYQFETWLSMQYEMYWREFSEDIINKLLRVYTIITNKETPNEMDKLIIAELVKYGYVNTHGNKVSLSVPFIPYHRFKLFGQLLEDIQQELGEDFFLTYYDQFAEFFEPEVPKFLADNIRNHAIYDIWPSLAVLGWIINQAWIKLPDKEEAKSVCTIVWQTEQNNV